MLRSEVRLGRFAAAALTVTLALTACQALVTLAVDAPAADGGADATPVDVADASDASTVDPCGAIPPAPAPIADAGAPLPRMVFAAYELMLDSAGDPELCGQPGFDLDGLNTGPAGVCTTNASCQQRRDSTARILNCDDTGGVDNNVLAAVHYLNQLPTGTFALDELDSKVPLSRGVTNMLLELADYNGQPEDDKVGVAFYSSAGMRGVPNAAGLGYEQVKDMPEVWDGGQDAAWVVTPSSVNVFSGQTTPRYFAEGYVRGGILVVPRVPLGFGPPSLIAVDDTALSDGVLTAEIVREGDRIALRHGRIGTSMKSSALLGTLGRIRSHADVFMCAAPEYDALRAIACTALDLPGLRARWTHRRLAAPSRSRSRSRRSRADLPTTTRARSSSRAAMGRRTSRRAPTTPAPFGATSAIGRARAAARPEPRRDRRRRRRRRGWRSVIGLRPFTRPAARRGAACARGKERGSPRGPSAGARSRRA